MVAKRPFRRGLAVTLTVAGLLLGTLGVAPVRAVALTFNVNTTGDSIDDDVANPACATSEGKCSLRAAVMQANALDPAGGHHTINVPAGTYTLTIGGPGEYDGLGGDLNFHRSTTLKGAGASKTFIQASTTSAAAGIDRLIDVRETNVDLAISGVTLRRGNAHASGGGAINGPDATGSLTLDDVVITNNVTADDGGALISSGTLVIRDSTISNNVSSGPAIDQYDGNLTIRRSTISGNDVASGTIRYAGGGTGLIDRSTISGNDNSGSSSGIAIQLGRSSDDTTSLLLRNSTIAANTGNGAAIGARESNVLTVESTTIAGNSAIGIWPSAQTTLKNTLLAGNTGGNCDAPLPVSLGHNLDTGTTCGFGAAGDIESGSAKLGSLAFNGGPTKTRALGEESDARDAGAGCPSFDQRGVSRPKDGDGDGTARCDIGAYEAATLVLPTAVPTAAPTEIPTAAPATAAPASAEPTAAPATTEPASAAPTDAPSAEPGTSPAASVSSTGSVPTAGVPGASPAPTAQPAPTGGGDGGAAMLWIVVAIAAIVVLVVVFLGLRRRRPPAGAAS